MAAEGNKPKPLQTSSAESLLQLLPSNWRPTTLDAALVADTIGIRGETIAAIAASGVAPGSAPILMYDRQAIAGLTVVRQEPEDSRLPNEPECNVDHYILCKSNHPNVKYCLYGPYRKHDAMADNAGLPHWPSYEAFGAFVQRLQQ